MQIEKIFFLQKRVSKALWNQVKGLMIYEMGKNCIFEASKAGCPLKTIILKFSY